jgi:restriction system protein
LDWYQFEKLIELIYLKLGYVVKRGGGANADGGIDLMIELNGERTAVQCKHWKGSDVGVKVVREFVGAMKIAGVSKGLVICTKGFTEDARELAIQQGIELVSGAELEALLKKVDAEFDPRFRALFESKEKRCPKCEREMVIRTARRGPDVGSKFWGCTGYPGCTYVMQIG